MRASLGQQRVGACRTHTTRHVVSSKGGKPGALLRSRVAQVDRVEVQPDAVPETQQGSTNGTSGTHNPKLENTSTTSSSTDVRPVAPAATAVGLVGAAASESSDRPFVPVIDFQELADTLLGDPEVVLRNKTLYGEQASTCQVHAGPLGAACPHHQRPCIIRQQSYQHASSVHTRHSNSIMSA